MNKKIALVTLIEQSFLLSYEAKLGLLAQIKKMGDEDVDALGKFLAEERNFIVNNEQLVKDRTAAVVASVSAMNTMKAPEDPTSHRAVYYGNGKP